MERLKELLKKEAGSYTLAELKEAEKLIEEASETEKNCWFCVYKKAKEIKKAINGAREFCRFHARYAIFETGQKFN